MNLIKRIKSLRVNSLILGVKSKTHLGRKPFNLVASDIFLVGQIVVLARLVKTLRIVLLRVL